MFRSAKTPKGSGTAFEEALEAMRYLTSDKIEKMVKGENVEKQEEQDESGGSEKREVLDGLKRIEDKLSRIVDLLEKQEKKKPQFING